MLKIKISLSGRKYITS